MNSDFYIKVIDYNELLRNGFKTEDLTVTDILAVVELVAMDADLRNSGAKSQPDVNILFTIAIKRMLDCEDKETLQEAIDCLCELNSSTLLKEELKVDMSDPDGIIRYSSILLYSIDDEKASILEKYDGDNYYGRKSDFV